MHPAFSVIFFTTASGAGYGLLGLLGVMAPLGLLPSDPWFGAIAIGLALILVTAGLLASTAHLGHPERAWRAILQWRSSWLSREGLAALATYIPALLFALLWLIEQRAHDSAAYAGIASALMAVVTVWCTAMIYASLKPIHQWNNALVVPGYLLLALMTGALLLCALIAFWGFESGFAGLIAAAAIVAAALIKWRYWRFIDTTRAASTVASATGLKGRVRFLDGPHTEDSYLQKEMGYKIARKHAVKLRRIALVAGFALPFLLSLVAFFWTGPLAMVAAIGAAALALAGVLIERWLFFAEAKHTVTLYYGADTV
jgi:DMSO reductase anchor subunit